MAKFTITLEFSVDAEADRAWAIAESLQQWADGKGFTAVSAFAADGDGRAGILSFDGAPPKTTQAMALRSAPGTKPMTFGFEGESVTVGGENGEPR